MQHCCSQTHLLGGTLELQALGTSRVFRKSTISIIFLCVGASPEVAIFCTTLHVVPSVVHSTLHTLNDVLVPTANWI